MRSAPSTPQSASSFLQRAREKNCLHLRQTADHLHASHRDQLIYILYRVCLCVWNQNIFLLLIDRHEQEVFGENVDVASPRLHPLMPHVTVAVKGDADVEFHPVQLQRKAWNLLKAFFIMNLTWDSSHSHIQVDKIHKFTKLQHKFLSTELRVENLQAAASHFHPALASLSPVKMINVSGCGSYQLNRVI